MASKTTKSLHPGPEVDQCLFRKLEEETIDLKAELADMGHASTVLEIGEQELLDLEAALSTNFFDLELQIKCLLAKLIVDKFTSGVVRGVKLPKIKTPTSDGNILNWGHFWEQFKTTVHVKEQFSGVYKLANRVFTACLEKRKGHMCHSGFDAIIRKSQRGDLFLTETLRSLTPNTSSACPCHC